MERLRAALPVDGEPVTMMPAEAYTSHEVLAWELRHLYAGAWTCLGRVEDLLPSAGRASGEGGATKPVTQRAVRVGDVAALLVRDGDDVRMFANTCRHRGHELLPDGGGSDRRSIVCPYHAWSYDLTGTLRAAPGFRDARHFEPADHGLVELPVRTWGGWLFGHAAHPLEDRSSVPSFDAHLGALGALVAPYAPERLVVGDRHTYEVAANWKVVAENYHECYHCPLIHPELCQVSPPDSGDNYDLPGGWVGGAMVLRDGMRSMTLTGELAATPLPGADPTRVEYLHLLPNLLVSCHPDYVMTHRLVPLAPERTWIECSWLVVAGEDGTVPDARAGVDFWDLTNRQDWAACESVQRGLSSPHFRPGPFAPNEDAVARLVAKISRAYLTGRLTDEAPSRLPDHSEV
jgi:Rieske 2Fe-2S family protein